MKHLLCAFAAVALLSTKSFALDPPRESHVQAAEALLEMMGVERTIMGGATAMVDVLVQQNAALAPYRDTVIKWAEKYVTWDSMAPKMVALYTETFSEAELRELIGFYGTPTGKKALATMPDLMKRGTMIGSEVARAHQADLERMILERAKELQAPKAGAPEAN